MYDSFAFRPYNFNHKMIRQYGGTQEQFNQINTDISDEIKKITQLNESSQKQIEEILSKKELNRQDARLLMRLLFDDSYFVLSEAVNIPAMFLKEQMTAIKIFTEIAQERILQASFKKIQKKPRVVIKN